MGMRGKGKEETVGICRGTRKWEGIGQVFSHYYIQIFFSSASLTSSLKISITCILGHSMLSCGLLMLFSFLFSCGFFFFFVLGYFYFYAFKFTNLFFCSV